MIDHAALKDRVVELGGDPDCLHCRLGTLVKFVPPLVVAGKVYVPTYDNALNVYGLLPSNQNAQTNRPTKP